VESLKKQHQAFHTSLEISQNRRFPHFHKLRRRLFLLNDRGLKTVYTEILTPPRALTHQLATEEEARTAIAHALDAGAWAAEELTGLKCGHSHSVHPDCPAGLSVVMSYGFGGSNASSTVLTFPDSRMSLVCEAKGCPHIHCRCCSSVGMFQSPR